MKGISYLEKAAAHGQETAKKYICLYRPDGKVLTDEEYETALADFEKAADAGDDKAYELYSTLKSGTQKQLARLGHVLIAAQNIQKSGYEAFKYSSTPSGIPLIPVAPKRRAGRTFLRFNLDAWVDEHPLIAVASDILSIGDSRQIGFMLDHLHRAKIVGTVAYRSPSFGWLPVEKDAVLIRLGTDDKLNDEVLKEIADEFDLLDEVYMGDSIAFMFENGEKDYSFEVAGIKGDQVEVLYRYTVGGSEEIREYNEPELMSLHFYEDGKESGKEPHLFRYRIKGGNAVLERYQGSDTEVQVPDCVDGYKVVRIGDYCFARCSFITSVALPDTVKNIGEGVFSGCSSLTSITLPDSLTMIGKGVFAGCSGLRSITLPEGLSNIRENAFEGCNLKDVWYTGSRDQWEKIITDHERCLLVPDIIFGNATIHFGS